jgi:CubicO group peptidase (beta-lactamase class C family)
LKKLKIIFILLILLVSLGGYVFFQSNPPEYVYRAVAMSPPTVDDYARFPYVEIKNSPDTFIFQESSDTSSELIEEAFNVSNVDIFFESTQTTSFLVIKNDIILYENYFNGADKESLLASFSVSKSVLSALIGIAIQENHIQSVDDPITNYIPELQSRGFDRVTIKNLLMMSSGVANFNTQYKVLRLWDADTRSFYHTDLRKVALTELYLDTEPGSEFSYNNLNPVLLGLILERSTNMSVSKYLEEKLWIPLEMEYPATWNIDSNKNKFEKMALGLNARAIDFTKFGRLFLNNGNWNGEQLISEDWISDSTQFKESEKNLRAGADSYYKYSWWVYSENEKSDFSAVGLYGQFLYISPENNVIIIRTGKEEGLHNWPELFSELADTI